MCVRFSRPSPEFDSVLFWFFLDPLKSFVLVVLKSVPCRLESFVLGSGQPFVALQTRVSQVFFQGMLLPLLAMVLTCSYDEVSINSIMCAF
jgi:hypothetical protein